MIGLSPRAAAPREFGGGVLGHGQVLPKGGLSRWPALTLFLEDGRVAIDNNAAERSLRPIGVGRRNWLFAGSDAGGETLDRAMTIIETAKMSGLDPQAYLADILDRIHDHMNNRLAELLPWNWTPKGAIKVQAA